MSQYAALLCALSVAACATTPSAPAPTPAPAAPEWLSLSGRIEPDETPDCSGSRFGVGGTKGIQNKSLLNSMAMSAARADLTRRLSACWSKRLEGRFPHQSELSPEEAKVSYEMALKQIIGSAQNAAVIVHTWQPDEQTEYVHLEVKGDFIQSMARE
jgi:hypothetical protein